MERVWRVSLKQRKSILVNQNPRYLQCPSTFFPTSFSPPSKARLNPEVERLENGDAYLPLTIHSSPPTLDFRREVLSE